MAYATSMIESIGAFVQFEFAAGNYVLASPIVIDWAGVTLKGSSDPNNRTVFMGDRRLSINAPSFRLIDIDFIGATGPGPIMIVGTGMAHIACTLQHTSIIMITICVT